MTLCVVGRTGRGTHCLVRGTGEPDLSQFCFEAIIYMRQSLELPSPFLVTDSVIQYSCSLTSFLQDRWFCNCQWGVGREREEPAMATVGLLCQMVFPHLRARQHIAFRNPGMLETHCTHSIRTDGHYDHCNYKGCHSILFHGLM